MVITSASDEDVWSEVLGRVKALLRSRGVDAATAEDISQEVAARALTLGIEYTSADDLMGWAGTVAVRLSIDDWRRGRRTWPAGVGLNRPGAQDAGTEAVHRVQLDEVAAVMSRLTPAQREAIVSGVSGLVPRDRSETVRLAVNRRRARLRLLAWTDGVAAGWGRVRIRFRSWIDNGQPAFAGLVPYVAAIGLALPVASPAAPSATTAPPALLGSTSTRLVDRTSPAASPAVAGGHHVPSVDAKSVSSRPAATRVASVPTPDGESVWVDTWETRPDDSLVCLGSVAGLPKSCFGKPLKPPLGGS